MQHVVLRNRPTLSIGTEKLACLNNPPWRAAGDPRLARSRSRVRAPGPAGALRTLFFSTLTSFLLREIFFSHLPHQTHESVRVIIHYWLGVLLALTLLYITKSHKNYLQNMQHVVLRNRPTLSIGTEKLACLNNPPWRAAGDPRLACGRSRVRAPGPAGALRTLFFSTLTSFLLWEIVFLHLPHQTHGSVRVNIAPPYHQVHCGICIKGLSPSTKYQK